MKPNPGFYCDNYIKTQNYIPKYKTHDCKQQCDKCINEIIDHHEKKIKNEKDKNRNITRNC